MPSQFQLKFSCKSHPSFQAPKLPCCKDSTTQVRTQGNTLRFSFIRKSYYSKYFSFVCFVNWKIYTLKITIKFHLYILYNNNYYQVNKCNLFTLTLCFIRPPQRTFDSNFSSEIRRDHGKNFFMSTSSMIESVDDERGSLGIYLKNRCYIEFTNWRLNIDFVYLT